MHFSGHGLPTITPQFSVPIYSCPTCWPSHSSTHPTLHARNKKNKQKPTNQAKRQKAPENTVLGPYGQLNGGWKKQIITCPRLHFSVPIYKIEASLLVLSAEPRQIAVAAAVQFCDSCLPDPFPWTTEEGERLHFKLQQKTAKNSACSQAAHCLEVPQLQFSPSYYHPPSFLLNWYKLNFTPGKTILWFPVTTFLLCLHYGLTSSCRQISGAVLAWHFCHSFQPLQH